MQECLMSTRCSQPGHSTVILAIDNIAMKIEREDELENCYFKAAIPHHCNVIEDWGGVSSLPRYREKTYVWPSQSVVPKMILHHGSLSS